MSGVVTVVVAVVLVVCAGVGVLAGWGWWVIAGLALVGGLFQIFEARAGWCALRAMGIRTPL